MFLMVSQLAMPTLCLVVMSLKTIKAKLFRDFYICETLGLQISIVVPGMKKIQSGLLKWKSKCPKLRNQLHKMVSFIFQLVCSELHSLWLLLPTTMMIGRQATTKHWMLKMLFIASHWQNRNLYSYSSTFMLKECTLTSVKLGHQPQSPYSKAINRSGLHKSMMRLVTVIFIKITYKQVPTRFV